MLSPVNMLAIILFSLLIASTEAFQRPLSYTAPRSLQSTHLMMVSGNKANFGLFSPAVVAAKFVLGEAKLNKVEEDCFFFLQFSKNKFWCLARHQFCCLAARQSYFSSQSSHNGVVLAVWSLQPPIKAGKRYNSGDKFDYQPSLTDQLNSATDLLHSFHQIKKAKKNGDRLGFLV